MCLTSTCHRTTMDQLLFLHQTLATDIPTLLDRSPYPASILILLPLGHEKVPLPLGCFHTTSWFSPRTPPPENLRLKLSRWAQITTAAPARHFLPRFNPRAPRVPLLLRPPSIHLTILIYRALIFAAPSLSLVTLLLCFSTRASTLPACPTPRRCSTAWPWHPLQHSPIYTTLTRPWTTATKIAFQQNITCWIHCFGLIWADFELCSVLKQCW